jgi:hypothetical protein
VDEKMASKGRGASAKRRRRGMIDLCGSIAWIVYMVSYGEVAQETNTGNCEWLPLIDGNESPSPLRN